MALTTRDLFGDELFGDFFATDPFAVFWPQGYTRSEPAGQGQGQVAQNQGRISKWMSPRTDIVDHEDKTVFHIDLPGIPRESLKVDLDERTHQLTISGEYSSETKTGGEQEQKQDAGKEKQKTTGPRHILRERRWGSFSRTFTVPKDTKGEDVKADLKKGVLSVEIKKRQPALPAESVKSITVG